MMAIRVRQLDDPLLVLPAALHRHKTAYLGALAHQVIAVSVERDGAGDSIHPQRHNQRPVACQLVQPGRRDVPGTDRNDDRCELAVPGQALLRVGPYDRDPVVIPGLASSQAGVDWQSGEFYVKRRPGRVNRLALDAALARGLWERSEQLLGRA